MFDLDDEASQREKCYTTVTQLPAFVDPKQPPTKKPPFSIIQEHPFVHTVEVILPEAVHSRIKGSLDAKLQKPQYARIFMPLASLLEADFFNAYIKIGNILMISERCAGTGNMFTLRDGILNLELGKEVFERTGLTGKPIRSGGRKHAKERYLVEINLRLPSMLHGKKGFERIAWAFQNVLNESVAWLFCDLSPETNDLEKGTNNEILRKLQPQVVACEMVRILRRRVQVPPSSQMPLAETSPSEEVQEHCAAISEWLAMVAFESPRVIAGDTVDPVLSRYSVPDVDDSTPSDLVILKWHGFISSQWITQLFIILLQETSPRAAGETWFSLSSHTLGKETVGGKDGYTIMPQLPTKLTSGAHGGHSEQSRGTLGPESAIRQLCMCWKFVDVSKIPHGTS